MLSFRQFFWLMLLVVLIVIFLSTTGCAIPISRDRIIPTDIASSPNELKEKFYKLAPKMTKKDVIVTLSGDQRTIDLNNSPNITNVTDGNEKMCILYGCFAVLSDTLAQEVREKQIYTILYKDSAVTMVPKPWKLGALFYTNGPDAKAHLIFDKNDMLEEIKYPDKLIIETSTEKTIFDAIGNIGAGGSAEAGKRLIRIP